MSGLAGLSSDTKVHLIFQLRSGIKAWCSGVDRKQHPKTFQWLTLPRLDDDAAASVPMRLDYAALAQRNWRDLGYRVRLALDPNGPLIDDEPASPTGVSAERVNMHYRGILIRPASCNRWCICMSNNVETIYSEPGGTPESVYEKLAMFPHLVTFAEPYVEPQQTDEEFARMIEQKKQAAQQQTVQQFGRQRPGNRI